MIRVMKESSGNVLGVEIGEELTHQDYREIFIPAMQAILEEHGKLRLLMYAPQPTTHWTPEAMWDDIRFGRGHRDEIEKMCLVSDTNLYQWSIKIYAELATDHAKNFARDQLREAWTWIRS